MAFGGTGSFVSASFYPATLSRCHAVTLSRRHPVILSSCRPVTLYHRYCLFALCASSVHHYLTDYGLDEANVGECYVAAMYWSIMTITTIGYGDVPAQSTPERAVVCVCMLLGAGMFAYVVGSVCGIIAGMGKEKSE